MCECVCVSVCECVCVCACVRACACGKDDFAGLPTNVVTIGLDCSLDASLGNPGRPA